MTALRDKLEAIAKNAVNIAVRAHLGVGPSLLESVYVKILVHELRKLGYRVETEVPVHVMWDGEDLGVGFRADIVVEGIFVIEVKSTEANTKLHKKQLLTYLRLLDCRLGLLLNFNNELMKEGIHRVVNKLE